MSIVKEKKPRAKTSAKREKRGCSTPAGMTISKFSFGAPLSSIHGSSPSTDKQDSRSKSLPSFQTKARPKSSRIKKTVQRKTLIYSSDWSTESEATVVQEIGAATEANANVSPKSKRSPALFDCDQSPEKIRDVPQSLEVEMRTLVADVRKNEPELLVREESPPPLPQKFPALSDPADVFDDEPRLSEIYEDFSPFDATGADRSYPPPPKRRRRSHEFREPSPRPNLPSRVPTQHTTADMLWHNYIRDNYEEVKQYLSKDAKRPRGEWINLKKRSRQLPLPSPSPPTSPKRYFDVELKYERQCQKEAKLAEEKAVTGKIKGRKRRRRKYETPKITRFGHTYDEVKKKWVSMDNDSDDSSATDGGDGRPMTLMEILVAIEKNEYEPPMCRPKRRKKKPKGNKLKNTKNCSALTGEYSLDTTVDKEFETGGKEGKRMTFREFRIWQTNRKNENKRKATVELDSGRITMRKGDKRGSRFKRKVKRSKVAEVEMDQTSKCNLESRHDAEESEIRDEVRSVAREERGFKYSRHNENYEVYKNLSEVPRDARSDVEEGDQLSPLLNRASRRKRSSREITDPGTMRLLIENRRLRGEPEIHESRISVIKESVEYVEQDELYKDLYEISSNVRSDGEDENQKSSDNVPETREQLLNECDRLRQENTELRKLLRNYQGEMTEETLEERQRRKPRIVSITSMESWRATKSSTRQWKLAPLSQTSD